MGSGRSLWVLGCALWAACSAGPEARGGEPTELARTPAAAGRAARAEPPEAPAPALSVEVVPSRGQLTATVRLPALPARAGLAPRLAITSDGSPMNFGGGFGMGFALSVPSITVGTELGLTLPRASGADPLITPLVYQGSRLKFVRALDGVEPKVVEYRPEFAEELTRIYYHRAPTTLPVLGGTLTFQGLMVVRADGSRELYGEEADVAEQDTFDAADGRKVGVTTRFPLRHQIAPSGDTITYRYEKISPDQRSYLRSVSFAGDRARYDFTLARPPRPPDRPVYDQGFEQRQTFLYTGVTGSYDGQIVSRTFFVYRTSTGVEATLFSAPEVAQVARAEFAASLAAGAPLSEESALVGVLRYGGGAGAIGPETLHLPPIRLAYADRTLADLRAQTRVRSLDVSGVGGFGAGAGAEYVDVDQDGLVDVVSSAPDGDQGGLATSVYLNTGDEGTAGFVRTARTLRVMGEGGALIAPDFVGSGSVWLPGDFDGDGIGDLVQIAPAAADGEGSKIALYSGRTDGADYFAPARGSFASKRSLSAFVDGRAQPADLNADGRDDLLIAERKDGLWRFSVLLNQTRSAGLPDGGRLAFMDLDGRFDTPGLFNRPALAELDFSLSAAEVRLSDVNGDGLVDLSVVRVTDAGEKGVCVFENRGAVRANVDVPGAAVAKERVLFGDRSTTSATCPGGYFVAIPELASIGTVNALWQIDVTGDGLADLVNVAAESDRLKVWAGRGREPYRYLGEIALERALRVDAENRWNTRVLDLDGDGQEEIVVFAGGERPTLQVVDFDRADGKNLTPAQLLTEASEGMGLRHVVQYAASTDELLRDRAHGRADARGLPFVTPVVKRLITKRGAAPAAVTAYRYHGPTPNIVERGLLGYREVEALAHGGDDGEDALTRITYDVTDDPYRSRVLASRERTREVSAPAARAEAALAAIDAAVRAGRPTLTFTAQTKETRGEAPLRPGRRYLTETSTWETDVPPTGMRPAVYVRNARTQRAAYGVGCGATGSCEAALETRSVGHDACNRPTEETLAEAQVAGPNGLGIPARREQTTIDYLKACDEPLLQTAAPVALTSLSRARRQSGTGRVIEEIAVAYGQSPFVPSAVTTTASVDTSGLPEPSARLVQAVPPSVVRYTYDAYFNVTETADALGLRERTRYDEAGVRVTASENALGHARRFEYAPGAIGPVAIHTPRGDVLTIAYDGLQRLSSVAQADGMRTTFAYREAEASDTRRVLVREQGGVHDESATLHVMRADGTPVARVEPAEGGGARVAAQRGYGRRDEVVREALPYVRPSTPAALFAAEGDAGWPPEAASGCGEGRVACTRHDALGRATEGVDASGRRRERAEHEAWGARLSVTDEARTRVRARVARGELVHGLVDEAGHVHRFERDDAEQLRAAWLAGEHEPRTAVVDGSGRLLLSRVAGGMSKVYRRDARGRVVRESVHDRALRDGGHTLTTYDALDRPLSRENHAVGEAPTLLDRRSWQYDVQEGGSASDVGSVVRATVVDVLAGSTFDERFSHDVDGRVTARHATYQMGDTVRRYEESWGYARDGQLLAYGDPFQNRFVYARTPAGRLAAVRWTGRGASEVLAEATAFDAFGHATTLIRPAHQLTETTAYDPTTGLLSRLKTCIASSAHCLQDEVIERRGDGRITARSAPELAASYAYTPRGELARATMDGKDLRYEVDPAGHFLHASEHLPGDFVRGDRPLALPAGYAADDFGRVVRGGTIADVQYDPEGRVRRVDAGGARIRYAYGADGALVARQVEGTAALTVYPTPGSRDDGRERQSLVTFEGEPHALIVNETVSYGLITDHLGAVAHVVGADGTRRGGFRFTPYGQIAGADAVPGLASLSLLQRFTGSLRDEATDLVQMGARTYLPGAGSFTTPDPLFLRQPELCVDRVLECGSYAYVAHDPINFVDPTGTSVMARLKRMARNMARAQLNRFRAPGAGEADAAEAGRRVATTTRGTTTRRLDAVSSRVNGMRMRQNEAVAAASAAMETIGASSRTVQTGDGQSVVTGGSAGTNQSVLLVEGGTVTRRQADVTRNSAGELEVTLRPPPS